MPTPSLHILGDTDAIVGDGKYQWILQTCPLVEPLLCRPRTPPSRIL